MTGPRIYVADLAAYNAGILHGSWIELEGLTVDDVQSSIYGLLEEGTRLYRHETCSSQHEEWAIHDYDEFGPVKIEEYEDLTKVVQYAAWLLDEPDKFAAWLAYNGKHCAEDFDPESVIATGEASLADYAAQMVEEGLYGEVPETLRRYINYEDMARDMDIEGSYVVVNNQLFEIV